MYVKIALLSSPLHALQTIVNYYFELANIMQCMQMVLKSVQLQTFPLGS